MKSSNMKVVLLAILSSVVAFCIVLMLIYLLATASNNTKKNSANAAVQSQSDVAKKSTEANAQVSAEGCTLYYVNQDTDFFTADMLSDDLDAAEKEAAEVEHHQRAVHGHGVCHLRGIYRAELSRRDCVCAEHRRYARQH